MPQRKQTDAVRNLRSYAVICHQARFGGFIIHFKQTRLLVFIETLCRAANIRRTIAQPDGAKLIFRPRRKPLWFRKGFVRAAAEPGDDGADARYVVVLADNKADERFKKRLMQNADSPPRFCRRAQIRIRRVDSANSGQIIGVRIKISACRVRKGAVLPVRAQLDSPRIPLSCRRHPSAYRHEPASILQRCHAEALSAFRNLRQINGIQFKRNHHGFSCTWSSVPRI